jgi:ABC-2 type transport system ATP-binding protein
MLSVSGLTKRYRRIPAVENVTFSIARGQILGYLGPNGSGKSTTVKMLTGLIEPTEGKILFEGEDVQNDLTAFKRRLGYVPEEASLYPHLTGAEYLRLTGRLRGMKRDQIEPKIDAFLRCFGLSGARFTPLSAYSKGMRQKILLSAALLHDPEVLILDEPFSGLDVTAGQVLKSLLKELAAAGKIIFYSSHVLEVVEKVCSHVVILNQGQVAANDSIENLRNLMALPSLEEVFSQLALHEDTETTARGLVAAMKA